MQVFGKFQFAAGEENDRGNSAYTPNMSQSDPKPEPRPRTVKEKPKGLWARFRRALQDWSNQDQADQEFDDTRV